MPDQTTVLTNYKSDRWPEDLLNTVKIWEAALATSAASTFFDAITLGPDNEKSVDGATGANNPINQVCAEAGDVWKSDEPLENSLQVLVSIGTGVPSVEAFGNTLAAIGHTLKSMATETEKTAYEFLRANSKLHEDRRYFRFNVLSGLDNVGLEEAAKRPQIVAATRRYIIYEETQGQLKSCAETLRLRECALEPDFS